MASTPDVCSIVMRWHEEALVAALPSNGGRTGMTR
jgi:hypothetical protein